MGFDRLQQVARSTIMQEEDALPDAPQHRGAELISTGTALRDIVSQACSHVVYQQIREQIRRLVAEPGARGRSRLQRRGMAQSAADRVELCLPTLRRWAERHWLRRGRKTPEVGKLHHVTRRAGGGAVGEVGVVFRDTVE